MAGGAGLQRKAADEACLRSLDRLAFMWSTLTRAVPGVVLRTSDGHLLRRPVRRLHRRLVEINDALLILAPYRDIHGAGTAEVGTFPSGASTRHARAIIETKALPAPLGTYSGDGVIGDVNARKKDLSSVPTALADEVRRLESLADDVQAKPRAYALDAADGLYLCAPRPPMPGRPGSTR